MADTTERTAPAEKATGLTDALPKDALKDAGQRLLGLLAQSAAEAASERVSSLSDRLTRVAENPEQGWEAAATARDFTGPSAKLASELAAAGAAAYHYRLRGFDHGAPYGAPHCLEIPLLFGPDGSSVQRRHSGSI